MNDQINVTFNDFSQKNYDKETRLIQIAKDYQAKMENPILGVKIGNEVIHLNTVLKKDVTLTFFDFNDLNGYKMYQAGLKFVAIVAMKELFGNDAKVFFDHSIDKGIMFTLKNGHTITGEDINLIIEKMNEIIKADLPIEKITISQKEAITFLESINETEKATNIRNVSNSIVILYKLKDSYNYFYTDMPYSTGVLNKFNIEYLGENNAVLMFPSPRSNNEVPKFVNHKKIVDVFREDKRWIEKLNVKYVSYFNDYVSKQDISKFIRMNELNFNNKVNRIAEEIISRSDKIKMVLIAGPSSSGKTTTTKKLTMALLTSGIKAVYISVDDYFKERTETPKDKFGQYDFESLNAIDIELFNSQLLDLISGKPVNLSHYDFLTGKKVFADKPTQIDDNTIILVEGLHCLNEELTKQINREAKYKLYLSPFTPLSIDRHNHVSTVDLRLIRRLIRDNRTRGTDVSGTIKNWQTVRFGEEQNIFPFIEEADAVLNTALVYELGVLKVYAEPLLYSVEVTSPYYEEARRLVSFLKSFFTIPSEYVPDDSILREFIGNGSFEK